MTIADRLRAEINDAQKRYASEANELRAQITGLQARLAVAEGRIQTLALIGGTLDELMEDEPAAPAAPATGSTRAGTGRSPRRDVIGAARQVVRDFMQAHHGVGPAATEVRDGVSLLLGTTIRDSDIKRVLDTLLKNGELICVTNRYTPPGLVIHPEEPQFSTAAG